MEKQKLLIQVEKSNKYLILIILFTISFSLKSINDSNENNCEALISRSKNYKEFYYYYKKNYKCSYSDKYIPTICPIKNDKIKRFSSLFGKRKHPIDNTIKFHYGLDISSGYGSPVHASASGTIIKSNVSDDGYGNQIEIEHKYGFSTKYAHMNPIIVKKGETVKKGDVIGFVGSTGKSTASHLHYEVKKNGKKIDPLPFCKLDSSNVYYQTESIGFVKTLESEMSGKTIKENNIIDTRRRRTSSSSTLGKKPLEKKKENINIYAVIDNGSIEIEEGDYVRIRTTEEATYKSETISKNTYMRGRVKFEINRVRILIDQIIINLKPIDCILEVYGNDGLPGLYVSGLLPSIKPEVLSDNTELEETPQKKSRKKEKEKKIEPNIIILYDNHKIIIK